MAATTHGLTVIANFKMTLFDKIFGRQKFDLEIKVPTSIEIVHMDDKVRFRGTKDDISKFAKEFYRLKELRDGQLCKLDKYTLKVSDYITPDREKENWIELPNHAWGIMGSKFNEVPSEYDNFIKMELRKVENFGKLKIQRQCKRT
jgi:hypothetical protein